MTRLRAAWAWVKAHAVLVGGAVLAAIGLALGVVLGRRSEPEPIPPTRPPPPPGPDAAVASLGERRDELEAEAAAVESGRTAERADLAPMDAAELAAEWRRLRDQNRRP